VTTQENFPYFPGLAAADFYLLLDLNRQWRDGVFDAADINKNAT
jgi:hypothetical protein